MLTDIQKAARLLGALGGRKGGDARAAKLSPARRKKIAVKAANARWARRKPKTTGWYQGRNARPGYEVHHYFDGNRAACNSMLKRGAATPDDGEHADRVYCGLCRKRLYLCKSKTERIVFVTERAKAASLEDLPTVPSRKVKP